MTILQQASQNVPGFAPFYQKFLQRMTIYDRAKSTTASYGRSLASLALHFNRVPTELTPEQIEEYLYTIRQRYTGGSDNCFKFSIYSLRFVFRQEGMDELRIKLPPIKRSKKLPVVLSKEDDHYDDEQPTLLAAPGDYCAFIWMRVALRRTPKH